MDNPDYSWEPPSEAEMKVIEARRERSDKISKIMGDYLLKGYKMLGVVCDCGTILLQDRQGHNYCIACSELDSDADKDNPATNEAAALCQVRERELASRRPDGDSHDSSIPNSPVVQHRTQSEVASQSPSSLGHTSIASTSLNCPPLAAASAPLTDSGPRLTDTLDIVNKKLMWATAELQRTSSVEYSVQLCQLIKACADAIQSLKTV